MILITGGNGYIGSAISELLISEGRRFRIFDNLSGSSPVNLMFLDKKTEFIWGDVRKVDELEGSLRDVETVFHLAAKLPTAPGMMDDVAEDVWDVNYNGTINLLELARKHDIRLIFASTCNIYGTGKNLTEESEVNPLNSYSRSKLRAEQACLEYHRNYGLDVKILRLASVYGYSPGVRFNLVANYFTLRGILGYPLTVFGDGSNWRPFVHVKDVAKAFLFFEENGKPGEIYNVGGENFTIGELAEKITKIVNPNCRIIYNGNRKPEFSYHVDFSRIKKTGFKTDYNLETGIRDLYEKLSHLRSYRR